MVKGDFPPLPPFLPSSFVVAEVSFSCGHLQQAFNKLRRN